MTRAQFRTTLLRRLGRSSSELANADLDQWIDAGLLDLGTRRFTFRELEKTGTGTTATIGIYTYARPADAFALEFLQDTTNNKILRRWPGSFTSFMQAKVLESTTHTEPPVYFLERGAQFLVSKTPRVAVSWIEHYYAKPAMGTDPANTPNIDDYWHKGVELLAFKYAAADLEDDERSARADAEWQEWFTTRDTPKRRSDRVQVPSTPIRMHPSWIRNPKTGI